MRPSPAHRRGIWPWIPMAIAAAALGASPDSAVAQEPTADQEAVIALAHASLQAITNEDPVGLTDLMIEGATFVALAPGGGRPRVTSREQTRARPMSADFAERGFDARAHVTGDLATVWMPYDFYTDGEWSHCGVDLFTMLRVDGEWLISSLQYTVEQPPACSAHPDGPPGAPS